MDCQLIIMVWNHSCIWEKVRMYLLKKKCALNWKLFSKYQTQAASQDCCIFIALWFRFVGEGMFLLGLPTWRSPAVCHACKGNVKSRGYVYKKKKKEKKVKWWEGCLRSKSTHCESETAIKSVCIVSIQWGDFPGCIQLELTNRLLPITGCSWRGGCRPCERITGIAVFWGGS